MEIPGFHLLYKKNEMKAITRGDHHFVIIFYCDRTGHGHFAFLDRNRIRKLSAPSEGLTWIYVNCEHLSQKRDIHY